MAAIEALRHWGQQGGRSKEMPEKSCSWTYLCQAVMNELTNPPISPLLTLPLLSSPFLSSLLSFSTSLPSIWLPLGHSLTHTPPFISVCVISLTHPDNMRLMQICTAHEKCLKKEREKNGLWNCCITKSPQIPL